ncbi:EpsG family protein [Thermosynechococcus sichuanensis E542]|uniref:EpsG family protein n=1 Tax=Thermosynechococcus sichuanensis E542 TaxID=2016101 RepID=A0A3B7MGP4_9CYAN|nr:EpsG family protein [Thermosynechococcus vestitus]AXY68624.1 EpsG family protein [Thermosynechococcus vestitus E542]
MFPYFLVFLLTLIPSIIETPKWYWIFLFSLYVIFIGLRFEVGGDWLQYIDILEISKHQPWVGFEALLADPAYHWINKIAAALNQEIYFVNLCIAVIYTTCLFTFCQKLKNPYLGLTVAFPYLTTVVAMGYTRQAGAIALELLALIALESNKKMKSILLFGLALLFHKTAIFLLLIPILMVLFDALKTGKVINVLVLSGLLLIVLAGALAVSSITDKFLVHYIGAGMSSSGALIRLSMNLLPATIFLLEYYTGTGHNLFRSSSKVYLALSWLVIFSFALLFTGSSTSADRLALYLIPIQIYVLGNLPYLFFAQGREVFYRWFFLVLGYSFLVLWIWLQFADHAFAWLPYRMYPFI